MTARGFGPYNASAAVHARALALPTLSFFDCTSRTGSDWMHDYYHAADYAAAILTILHLRSKSYMSQCTTSGHHASDQCVVVVQRFRSLVYLALLPAIGTSLASAAVGGC